MLAAALTAATLFATPVATSGHVVAWWDNAQGHHIALAVWRPGHGRPRRIPGVRPAPIGDSSLDVGKGPDGDTWAVYTKCTTGGCRPWGVDLRTGARRDLGVGRGRDAAIWGHHLVFARHGRLYGATVDVPDSVHPLPLAHGQHVLATELRGDRVAYVTQESGDDPRGQGIFRQHLHGAASHRPAVGGGWGEECTSTAESPTLSRAGLAYLRFVAGERGVCGAGRSALVTPSGERPVPVGTYAAVRVGGRTIALAPPRGWADVADREPCTAHGRPPRGCAIHVD